MIQHLRRARDRVKAAIQRNAELAAAIINSATALHYLETSGFHPAVPGTTRMSWHVWDGQRWRRRRQPEE